MRNHLISRIAAATTFTLLALAPAAVSAREYDFVISSISLTLPPAIEALVKPIGVTCELFAGGAQLNQTTVPISLTNGTYNGSNVRVVVNYVSTSSYTTPTNYECWLSSGAIYSLGNPELMYVIQQKAGTGDAAVTTSNLTINGTF